MTARLDNDADTERYVAAGRLPRSPHPEPTHRSVSRNHDIQLLYLNVQSKA